MRFSLFIMVFISLPLRGQMPGYGSVTDREGHEYKTVVIGDYEWMAENLKVTVYNDGTEIPLVTDNGEWPELTIGAYSWYDNDPSNGPVYGALYNWYAVNTGKLCPDGWRIPSDMEWNNLEATVDSRYAEGDPEWFKTELLRGFDAAVKLKSVAGWRSDGNGSDRYGFGALPGGERRIFDGTSFQKGAGGFWWCSTEADVKYAWFRSMFYSYEQVARNRHDKNFGFSVRCLRETDP